MRKIAFGLIRLWDYLREVTGGNDYLRYRAQTIARGEEPLSRQEFYLQQLERKYSRVSQCC